MIQGVTTATDLRPAPLRPDQILDGQPLARSLDLGKSPDGKMSFNLWDVTAGRFSWVYHSDEIIHVLEGEVTIVPKGGAPRTLRPGDVAYFQYGLHTEWTVPVYLKKLAIHRDVDFSLASRVAGKVRKLVRRVTATAGLVIAFAAALQMTTE